MAVGEQAVDGIQPAGSQQKSGPLGRQSWLGHVALRVQDMERAKRFYGAMGLELTWDASDWAYLQRPGGGDGIALLSPDYKAAGPHFAFHFSSREQVQVPISFPPHKPWVDRFMGWWEYGIRSWKKRAGPDETLTFLCEFGPPPYAITGADGYELSDRWQEALMMKDMIRALWARIEAEDRTAKAAE